MTITIAPMQASDWEAVREIYLEGIATRMATFETEAPAWEAWDAAHLPQPRLVARQGGQVIGWVALSPVSKRPVYVGVAEVSIYVAAESHGQGVGSALMATLIDASEALGIWTLQAGIFPENQASLRLHQKFGFRLIGRRERIGQLDGVWRDTLQFERRSQKVGV